MIIENSAKEETLFKNSKYYQILTKLRIEIYDYYNIKLRITKKNDEYKIYPISLSKKDSLKLLHKVLKKISLSYSRKNIPLETLILEEIEYYKNKRYKLIKTLKNFAIKPYYGTPEFICTRIKFIIYQIQKLHPYKYNFKHILTYIDEFEEKYPKINHKLENIYPYYNNIFKNDYQILENIYLNILNLEKELTNEIKDIWKNFLTNPNNHNDNHFAYIVHTFSKNLINPTKMKKACCTLATNKLLTIPYGTCGIIYEYDPNSIVAMCTENARSWLINKEKFIDLNIPISYQLTEEGVFFECPYLSTLILPEDFEHIVIANNISYNGELLNYDQNLFYSEIFLNNKAKPIGVFYTDEHNDLLSIEQYAKNLSLPLIHLSLTKQRDLFNLPLKKTNILTRNNKY